MLQFSIDGNQILAPSAAKRCWFRIFPNFKLFPIYREILIWDILSYQIVLNFEEDQLGRVGSLKLPMQALDPDFPNFHSHHRTFPTYPCLNFCQFHCWRDFVYTEPGERVLVGQMYVEVFPKEILVPFCLFQNGVDLFGSFQHKREAARAWGTLAHNEPLEIVVAAWFQFPRVYVL